jgi:hypothetical protein
MNNKILPIAIALIGVVLLGVGFTYNSKTLTEEEKKQKLINENATRGRG